MKKILKKKASIAAYILKKKQRKYFLQPELWLNSIKHYKTKEPLKVLITGVPRSGTSFLTGLITKMGLSAGPDSWLVPGNQHNLYGYYECQIIYDLVNQLFEKDNSDFYFNFPKVDNSWMTRNRKITSKIKQTVKFGGIEVLKENKLIVLSDYFNQLFPDTKWIFIKRNIDDTFKSQFGGNIKKSEFIKIIERQLESWNNSEPSKKALHINYEDFQENIDEVINQILIFLNLNITQCQLEDCKAFFKPRKK